MYRTGKIDPESMPHTVILSVDSEDSPQSSSISKELTGEHLENFMKEAREVHMALELLKEGRISGAAGAETLLKGFADIQAASKRSRTSKTKVPAEAKPKEIKTLSFVPVVELNDECRPTPCLESFLDQTTTENAVYVTGSLSPRKRKAEEAIELDLTMATRSSSPKIQFPCPSTPEEATLLSLGLA